MTAQMDNRYRIQGAVLDVWSGTPFWMDSGDGSSVSVTCWLIDEGEVAGIAVAGTPVVAVSTKASGPEGRRSRRLILMEEEAPPEVIRWVLDAFQGRLGGPLCALAGLTGDQIGFYQVPISYRLDEERSSLTVPDMVKVVASGRRIPEWHPAGSAAPWRRNWLGRGSQVWVEVPEFGMEFTVPEAKAERGSFRFAS